MKKSIKIFFVAIFFIVTSYILYIETERYESVSITLLKDLSQKQEMSLGAMLMGKTSSTTQDSKILELYIRSFEMFTFIDKKFNIARLYASENIDPYQRLYKNAIFPKYQINNKNLLKKYNDNLFIVYDDPSSTLTISFVHTDPKIAKEILESIIKHSDEVINKFAKENAKVALHFIEKQRNDNKQAFITSIEKLIQYQNKNYTIDPNLDVERKNTILANLEFELVKNEVEYNSKIKTYNPNGVEMKMLKATIENIKRSIKRIKTQMVGETSNENELNTNVFDFELLKSNMEFSKEVYRQTLINQEELKIEVSQNAKHLIIISKPTLADSYSYPNKVWDIFTLSIILVFMYSIIVTIIAIIKDHKD